MDLTFVGECDDCGANIELSIKTMDPHRDRIIVGVSICEKCKKAATDEGDAEGYARGIKEAPIE